MSPLQGRSKRFLPIVFFVFGFAFDAYMLRRIDETLTLVQQAVYLAVAGALICCAMTGKHFWKYQDELMHFLLGTLLNAYTIFFFKAASLFTAIGFICVLIALLLINESKQFRERSAAIRIMLWSLCAVCYFNCLVPIVLGYIGTLPFFVAMLLAAVSFGPLSFYLKHKNLKLYKQAGLTFSLTQTIFALLYFTNFIPPVPLSISSIGIYHDIIKDKGEYQLVSTRSRWKFWQNGDQSFSARPGDRINCFVQVFSPARFSEKLQIRWARHDARRGWTQWDAIPLAITGGREEGFRGLTTKANYEPGDWRVQIETHDNRELGRIYFTVTPDDSTGERETHIDRR